MNQEQAKAWLPLIQAAAEGKTLQRLKIKQGTFETVWCDIEDDLNFTFLNDMSRIRIKPKTFQNFELPWNFIDQRWNYATYVSDAYGAGTAGVILYEKKPKFCEPKNGELCRDGWNSEGNPCTFCPLVVNQEGINECDWLACRNPEGEA